MSYSTNPGSTGTAASRSVAACASGLVGVGATLQQGFDQSGDDGSEMNDVADCEFVVYDDPKDLDSAIGIATACFFLSHFQIDQRQPAQ